RSSRNGPAKRPVLGAVDRSLESYRLRRAMTTHRNRHCVLCLRGTSHLHASCAFAAVVFAMRRSIDTNVGVIRAALSPVQKGGVSLWARGVCGRKTDESARGLLHIETGDLPTPSSGKGPHIQHGSYAGEPTLTLLFFELRAKDRARTPIRRGRRARACTQSHEEQDCDAHAEQRLAGQFHPGGADASPHRD